MMTETGNNEFKAIRMEAIWQLVDSIIIPIKTSGAEGWIASDKDTEQLPKIVNKTIKTLLSVPQSNSTILLLAKTGFYLIDLIINKKNNNSSQETHQERRSTNKTITADPNSICKKTNGRNFNKI